MIKDWHDDVNKDAVALATIKKQQMYRTVFSQLIAQPLSQEICISSALTLVSALFLLAMSGTLKL